MTAIYVLGFGVDVAAVAFVAETLRRSRPAQRRRDVAFDLWLAAGGNEAALHEDTGSATVVVLDVRSATELAEAERALTDGVSS